MTGVENSLRTYFGKRGDQVVADNLSCVLRGFEDVREVPEDCKTDASVTIPATVPQPETRSEVVEPQGGAS